MNKLATALHSPDVQLYFYIFLILFLYYIVKK